MPTAIDLFSGAGGMALGLKGAGFDVLAGFDNWEAAVASYSSNFSHPSCEVDLGAVDADYILDTVGVGPGVVDLVAGGPPCQGFSIQRIGKDVDPRNDLVVHFARLVIGISPKSFLMENVPGLLGRRGSGAFEEFSELMHAAGYEMEVHRVDAADFGVAQRRPRVVVYGWLKDLDRPTNALVPLGAGLSSVRNAFAGLPGAAAPGTVDSEDPLHVASRLSALNQERLTHIPPGGGFEDLPIHLRANCHRNGASKIGHRSVYGRLDPDVPANVITARFDSFTRGRFAHPWEDRNITLREGARLQSFPDDFKFSGNREQIAAQIGNAVPPRMAEVIGKYILEHHGRARGVLNAAS